jgi:hypothetical protein
MTNSEETSTQNTAGFGAYVGIQGGWVHDSNVYINPPDASPSEKYELGVRLLEVGVPVRAREQIEEAIARGHDNVQVRFHWVMAMLSKRAYRDLNVNEREQLSRIPDFLEDTADDDWKRALEAIHDLLECLQSAGGDAGPALKAIGELPKYQREQVGRHLDLVLTGGAKDNLWAETRQIAVARQFSGDRFNRVWTYFEPDPIDARARKPNPIATTVSDVAKAIVWAVPFVGSAFYVGRTLVTNTPPIVVICYLSALCASYFAFRNALEWHCRALRLRTKELAHWGRPGVDTSRDGKFAAQVESSFEYYCIKYAPKKMGWERWLAATANIRAAMRDEIVALYGESEIESEVEIGRVRWLIRYMVRDMTSQWAKGTLREYRKQLRPRLATKLWCVLSFSVLLAAMAVVVLAAVHVDQVEGTITILAFLLSGTVTANWWSRIIGERRRFADDTLEYEQVLADRQVEHERWWDKIESLRPVESEMESWLNSDKTIMLADALRHYKLAWRDVIAHAFLQTPARDAKKARMSGCPWRYSVYDMRIFLVTQDGMREYRTEFDFEHAVITRNERNNFRFDAVSSVGVIKMSGLRYILKLRLNNGPPSRIRVTDAAEETEDNPEKFSELNLDAAGFRPTLHILEGIAAEGKGWIERDPQLCGHYARDSSVIDDF